MRPVKCIFDYSSIFLEKKKIYFSYLSKWINIMVRDLLVHAFKVLKISCFYALLISYDISQKYIKH